MPKMVLLALADMAGQGGDQAWPSVQYLVDKTGMSRCSVMRSVQHLVSMGLVKVQKRPNKTNVYQIWKSHSETPVVSERDHGSLTVRPPQSQSETQTNKEPIKNQPRTKKKDDEVKLPVALNTPAFKEAFDGFREMRRLIKAPLTPRAIGLVISKLEGFGHDLAIQSLDRSTENNWKGVFDPRDQTTQGKKGATQAKRTTWSIKADIENLTEIIKDLQTHRAEVAGGEYHWPNPEMKQKHRDLCTQRKALRIEQASLA